MIEDSGFRFLQQAAMGYALPRSLHVVAELGVADHLDEEPQTGSVLAKAVDADAEALTRLLRSDHPQSQRPIVRMLGRGKQRTKPQFEQLYLNAGFMLERVIPTRSRLSIIEGVVV
jgi:hypothetical protein